MGIKVSISGIDATKQKAEYAKREKVKINSIEDIDVFINFGPGVTEDIDFKPLIDVELEGSEVTGDERFYYYLFASDGQLFDINDDPLFAEQEGGIYYGLYASDSLLYDVEEDVLMSK